MTDAPRGGPTTEAPHPDVTTMGELWRDPAGQEWRQVGYSSLPSVMFVAEGASVARLSVAVDSPLARSFERVDT